MRKRPQQYMKNNANSLRNNMTKQEKHLWHDFLKKLPLTIRRQQIIGNYIVDFFIASAQLVIEVDSAQHAMEMHEQSDKQRANI